MRKYVPVPSMWQPYRCDVCGVPASRVTRVKRWDHVWEACSDACAEKLTRGEVDPGNPLCVPPRDLVTGVIR